LTERYTRHFCLSQYEKVGWIAECEGVRIVVRPVYCFLTNIYYGINKPSRNSITFLEPGRNTQNHKLICYLLLRLFWK